MTAYAGCYVEAHALHICFIPCFPCMRIAFEAAFAKHFPDIVFIENAVAVRELCGSFAVAVIEIPRQGSQKCHKILKAE